MSTNLKGIEARNGPVLITRFFGGRTDRVCVQIMSQNDGYIQLTRDQAQELIEALQDAYAGRREAE